MSSLQELITDLKAAGANENTVRLAMNCYELGKTDEREACANDKADSFVAGFMCAGGDVGEAKSQALQFVSCCNASLAGVHS